MSDYVFSTSKQFKAILDMLKQTNPKIVIHYFYPENFNKLPCISYKLAGNTILSKTINAEPRRQESAYQVDLWDASAEVLDTLATELKTIMLKYKWTCTFEQDLKEPAELYYHKSMRFALTFDNKLKISL